LLDTLNIGTQLYNCLFFLVEQRNNSIFREIHVSFL